MVAARTAAEMFAEPVAEPIDVVRRTAHPAPVDAHKEQGVEKILAVRIRVGIPMGAVFALLAHVLGGNAWSMPEEGHFRQIQRLAQGHLLQQLNNRE